MDRRAIAEFGLTSATLMEAAGSAVVAEIHHHFPSAKRIGVICGKGNNGGDGFVVARLLGATAFALYPESELSPACLGQFHRAQQAGVPIVQGDPDAFDLDSFDLLVDAVLGTGFTGKLRPELASVFDRIQATGTPILSVDVPSGLDCNTGQSVGISAHRTVTFGNPKRGMFLADGPNVIGAWTVADIGFPPALQEAARQLCLPSEAEVSQLLPTRARTSHKGTHGRVLIIAGSDTMPGACILAATAALRAGAGLVCVSSTPQVFAALSVVAPECIQVPESRLEAELAQATAVVVGPGLGTSTATRDLLAMIFSRLTCPACVDADALNLVAQGLPLPRVPALLTPHPKELNRLLGTDSPDRIANVNQAVKLTQKTVLLKGAFTIIGTQNEPLSVNPTGNPGMATAGMGDALAGIAGTFLAQGLSPHLAGILAAYIHGAAGDLAALEIGSIGFTTQDLIARIPKVRAKLVQSCVASPRNY